MSEKIWVVLQHRDGKLHRMSWEAIAAGQRLAEEVCGSVEAILLGSGLGELASEAAGCDLAAVHTLDHEALSDYTPGAFVGALAAALAQGMPQYVIFPHTYQTVDFMARLAQQTDTALIPEVTGFELVDGAVVWRRPILGGKLEARVKVRDGGSAFVSIQSGVFSPDDVTRSGASAEIRSLDPGDAVRADREILAIEEAAAGDVDLTQSELIVSVGRGVGGPENLGPIEELARTLGAELGASRPVIDNGWLARERQVGSSGQTVSPKLYVAVGISGAIQHLVGMKGSQVIVAINKDPSAPIFNVAHYGIVGDLHEIVPAITAAVKQARGE